MAHLTDYSVLRDAPFELDSTPGSGIPDRKNFIWNAPSDLMQGVGTERPILSYIYKNITTQASFGIWINPNGTLRQTTRDHSLSLNLSAKFDHASWEAIRGTKFDPGRENTITFALLPADSGRIRIRDVVLWFQRRV